MSGFGLDLVLWLQANLGFLTPLMQALSFLGTTEFLLLLGLTTYWCIDVRIGIRLGLLLVTGAALGGILKLAFHMPRPYWCDARVGPLAAEPTYGMPSIHALYSWAIAPWLGGILRHRWGLAAGILLALGISLSRLVLGVHFPGDVAAGFAAGLATLSAVFFGVRHLVPWLRRAGFPFQCLTALAASGILVALQGVILAGIEPLPDPASWAENAARIAPIFPRNPNHLVSLAGLAAGMGIGLAGMHRRARFDAGGPLEKRILRFLLGFSVTLFLWGGLSILWNEPAQPGALVLRYIRYGLVGLWTAFGAPWIFLRWNLARRAEESTG